VLKKLSQTLLTNIQSTGSATKIDFVHSNLTSNLKWKMWQVWQVLMRYSVWCGINQMQHILYENFAHWKLSSQLSNPPLHRWRLWIHHQTL